MFDKLSQEYKKLKDFFNPFSFTKTEEWKFMKREGWTLECEFNRTRQDCWAFVTHPKTWLKKDRWRLMLGPVSLRDPDGVKRFPCEKTFRDAQKKAAEDIRSLEEHGLR